MTTWPQKRIDDIAEKVGMGPFGSSIKVETFIDKGVPIISSKHLFGISVDSSKCFNFISDDHAESLRNSLVYKGDLILTHRGNIGQASYIKDNFPFRKVIISQSQFYLRPDQSKILPAFLAYFFKTPLGQHLLLANSSQVGVPAIARPVSYIKTISVPVPRLDEQRAIVNQLETFDRKIELNQQMNETLESMVREIFQDWFVDFGPTRRKMKGATDIDVILGGLSSSNKLNHLALSESISIDNLFPSTLAENGLPKGYRKSNLGNLVIPKKGKSITKKKAVAGEIPVVAGGRKPAYYHNISNVSGPVITISSSGTAGFVRLYNEDIWASDCSFINKNQTEYLYSIYTFLKHNQDEIYRNQQGAVQPHVYPSDLMRLEIIDYPMDIWREFENLIDPLFRCIAENQEQSKLLVDMRDFLLPRIISGEIQLKDIEGLT